MLFASEDAPLEENEIYSAYSDSQLSSKTWSITFKGFYFNGLFLLDLKKS